MTVSDGTEAERRTSIVDRAPRVWTLWAATRPSQVALVVVVYALGVGMATAGPPLTTGEPPVSNAASLRSSEFVEPVLVGAIALVPVTVAVHYANEYADRETDRLTTRTPFSGGSGALERSGLSDSFLRSATIGAGLVASIVLLVLVGSIGLPADAALVLLAIFGLGLAYSLPPIAFVRHGLGEGVNALLGGLLLPLYGVAVVGSPTRVAALALVPFTLLVGCNLFATHWPDREADERVGKRTLAVRLSPTGVRRGYVILAGAGAIATAGLWTTGVFPNAVAVAHLPPLPFLVWGGVVVTRQRSPLPAVLAMVILAIATTVAWWWVGIVA